MKVSTALNHQNRFLLTLKSIYSAAESYGSSHEEIIVQLNKYIYEPIHRKHLPRHVKEYIFGYGSCLFHQTQNNKLTWVHIWQGVAYKSWNEAPEECKQAMRDNKGDSTYVWSKYLPAIKRF